MQDFEGLDHNTLGELVKSQAEAIKKLTEAREGVSVPVPVPLPIPIPIGSGTSSPAGGASVAGSPTKPAPIWGHGPGPPGPPVQGDPGGGEGEGGGQQAVNLTQDYYQPPSTVQVCLPTLFKANYPELTKIVLINEKLAKGQCLVSNEK